MPCLAPEKCPPSKITMSIFYILYDVIILCDVIDLQSSVKTRDGPLAFVTLKKVEEKGYKQEGEVIVDVEKAEKMVKNREYLEKVRKSIKTYFIYSRFLKKWNL